MDEEPGYDDPTCQPIQLENRSEMLPVVNIKTDAMDGKPFELDDPTDFVQVTLRVKEELPDVKDLPDESLEMEHSTEFVPVFGIKEELPDVKSLEMEHSTEFVPVFGIKEELPDVEDELIPVHYLEVSPAHSMNGWNTDNDNIKPKFRTYEDPLSIVEKQSGCDSADKASCNYKPSEPTLLEVTKYWKRKTSKNNDFNNDVMYNEDKPADCFSECGKIVMPTVRDFGGKKYICNECEKCFTLRRNFLEHLQIHSGERRHKCDVCGKCFSNSGNLVRHSLTHSGERKHKCQDCGKCFIYHSKLVEHSLIHSGERRHKCQVCGKCFVQRSNLVSHSVIHSGERKHQCQECGKYFTRRKNLVSHSLIHSGVKKHKCQDCGKGFTQRVHLVNHSLTHSGERKHECQDCGKCYTCHSNLVRHSLIHSR